MSRILHLSDLHIGAAEPSTLRALVSTLSTVGYVDLTVITGDLFDTCTIDDAALDQATWFHAQLRAATHGAPIIFTPGNHDVRKHGVRGPHSTKLLSLFAAQQLAAQHFDTLVHGVLSPGATTRIDPAWHHLPVEIIAVDSSKLARGWISAGGEVLPTHLVSEAAKCAPDMPLVVLLHHHLVPTPITDLEPIAVPGWLRWLLGLVVANADREETMMTALGAGDMLTTLHMLGRAVLVLHGHKHFPEARLLVGLRQQHGDVGLVAAGSAGLVEHVCGGKLAPSFNIVELDANNLRVVGVGMVVLLAVIGWLLA